MRLAILLMVMPVMLSAFIYHCMGQAADQRIAALQERVEINGETILLSDLLPREAREDLRSEAKRIRLGASPQPGSIRVLQREEVLHRLLAQGWPLSSVQVPKEITIARPAHEIDSAVLRASVSQYLKNRGWGTSEIPEGQWLQSTVRISGTGSEELDVVAMEWDAVRRMWRFQVRCSDHGQCGRFVVWAALPHKPSMVRETQGQTFPTKTGEASLTRPGERAILVLEKDGMRISMPVVCLERGVRQQQIRVRDLENRRTFLAEVTGERQLRALF